MARPIEYLPEAVTAYPVPVSESAVQRRDCPPTQTGRIEGDAKTYCVSAEASTRRMRRPKCRSGDCAGCI